MRWIVGLLPQLKESLPEAAARTIVLHWKSPAWMFKALVIVS
jgi:hypothetical protein